MPHLERDLAVPECNATMTNGALRINVIQLGNLWSTATEHMKSKITGCRTVRKIVRRRVEAAPAKR